LLGGEGADELFLGYRRYRALQRLPRLPWLARWTRRLHPWSMRAGARLARAVTAPNPIRALLAVTPPAFGREVLAGPLADAPCWRDAEPLRQARSSRARAGRDDDLAHYLPRDLLPKLDVALLAAGVEGRCPYLEAGIEAFGADLSALGKRPLRAAFAARLPSAVKRLPKRGFSLPLDAWFRGELDALDVLAEQRARRRPHLRPDGRARAVDQHRPRRSDLGHGLYLLYAYELHLRDEEQRRGAG
ncbi:MAG: asparagine synthase-related protein, partial [Planctomycetota bacterium]|nr:asparagine synthase-related protein [Planctomycetota bacterium]